MEQIVLTVKGMSCNHCKMRVEGAVAAVPGVEKVSVDIDKGVLTCSAENDDAVVSNIKQAISEAGYLTE